MELGNQQGSYELAWLAGFFDGEGCVQLRRAFKDGEMYGYIPELSFINTHYPSIERAIEILKKNDLAFHVGEDNRNQTRKRGWNNKWRIRFAGIKRAKRFVEAVLPYSETKKGQLQLIKDFCDFRLNLPQQTPQGEYEDSIKLKISELNHKSF